VCGEPDDAAEDAVRARRQYVLLVFALLEHPDALPADMALRSRQEAQALTRLGPSRPQHRAAAERRDRIVPSSG
jgi:hypothetical protein